MTTVGKLQELFQKEVSRKDFLRYIGVALLGLVGVSALIQNLTTSLGSKPQKTPKAGGYGRSPYGR